MTKNDLSLIAFTGGALLLAAATLPFSLSTSSPSGLGMEVVSNNWSLNGFQNDLDISGIASIDGSHCLIVSDEGFMVQPGLIDRSSQTITATGAIKITPAVNSVSSEIDFEGATYSEAFNSYFVVGSHGLAGRDADFDPNRFSIYQIKVDPKTGSIDGENIKRSSLLPWIEKNSITSQYVKRPLNENGLNIEGVASHGGDLYFGLRGPNHEGDCLVLQIGITTLFGESKGDLIVHRLPIGTGIGLRDITPVKGGFLFIARSGGTGVTGRNSQKGYHLYFWNGKNAKPKWLGTLPDNKGKAEALFILEESEKQVDALVLFDGLPGGAPLHVRFRQP